MSEILETIAIGDELLTGKISDTNTTFVANYLFARGARLSRVSVILDDIDDITSTLETCAKRAKLVLCFGGLGPTSDDKTVDAVCKLLGCGSLEYEPSRLKMIKFHEMRKRPMNANAMRQVRYPDKAKPFANPRGIAPAFRIEYKGCTFYFMPGVPVEMKAIMAEHIGPEITERLGAADVKSRVWRCLNITESELQSQMDAIEAALPAGAWLGYRTRFPENHLTLYLRGSDSSFEEWISKIRPILAPYAYTEEAKEPEELVLELLKKRDATLAVAESCTGGLVANRLTNISGSSENFWGGVTVYQLDAKARLLNVELSGPLDAVSADCTRRLAESLKRVSGCDVAAAVTGYMGPTGGTETDIVGTAYLCVKVGETLFEKRLNLLPRDREILKWGTATHLLDLIRTALEK